MKILAGVVGVVILLLWCGPASAAEKKRVGIPRFVGQQEALIRKKVMQAVRANGYDLVKSAQIASTAETLGASLDSTGGFKMLAKDLAISAFVTGEVSKKKVKLTVRNAADGSVSAQETFTGPSPSKIAADIASTFWQRLGAAIDHSRTPAGAKKPSRAPITDTSPDDAEEPGDVAAAEAPPPVAEAAPVPAAEEPAPAPKTRRPALKPDVEADQSAPSATGGPLPRALDIAVGPRLFFRSFTFNQVAAGTMVSNYQPRLLGDAGAMVDWYPGAHVTNGFAANLGLELNLQQAFGINSTAATGGTFATNVHEYDGAVRLRLPLGAIEGGIILGYGQNAFTFTGSGRAGVVLPDTTYNYVRFGVGLRAPITEQISFTLGAGYRDVLSSGQIATSAYFPHLTVAGIEANGGLGYRVSSSFEARAGIDFLRYFYDMHSKAGDNRLAGGAVDQTVAFTISLAYLLGGEGTGGGSAAKTSDGDEGAGAKSDAKPARTSEGGKTDGQPDGQPDATIKPKRKKKLKMESDSPPGE